jgi:hypothetical protein
MNCEILLEENRRLRHQLQTLVSLHRLTVAALEAFHEHLLAAALPVPILQLAELLGR